MDVFNQNWTERIHQDPYVSMLLHHHDDVPIKMVDVWKRWPVAIPPGHENRIVGMRTYVRFNMPLTEREAEFLKKNPTSILKDPITKKRLVRYYTDWGRGEPKLHENTRPQSLYNLHYATLR